MTTTYTDDTYTAKTWDAAADDVLDRMTFAIIRHDEARTNTCGRRIYWQIIAEFDGKPFAMPFGLDDNWGPHYRKKDAEMTLARQSDDDGFDVVTRAIVALANGDPTGDIDRQIARAVNRVDFGTATARKSGRDARWPYVPVIITNEGRTSAQVLGRAYATRVEAVERAERQIRARRDTLAVQLADPRYRALREQHGLPREIPTRPLTLADFA